MPGVASNRRFLGGQIKKMMDTLGGSLKGLLLHIPVGMFQVFCAWLNPALAIAFLVGFMVYEVNEDWHLKDRAYYDIRGYLWGIVLGAIGLAIFTI